MRSYIKNMKTATKVDYATYLGSSWPLSLSRPARARGC